MAGKLQVIGSWANPFSCRVELALKLKGLDYDLDDQDLLNKKIKFNPTHNKLPVLLHAGKPIAESLIIIEYIDDNWKSEHPILPENPHERAVARFWAKFVDDKFLPALVRAVRSEGGERETAEEEAREALAELETELDGKRFFGGERIGFVDIAAVLVAGWVPAMEEVYGMDLLSSGKFPQLRRWRGEFVGHGLVNDCLPPGDKLAEHLSVTVKEGKEK